MNRSPPRRRIVIALGALVLVLGGGTLGYLSLRPSPLDALTQMVITVSTVGFREVFVPTIAMRVLTIVLILVGVGTGLDAFGAVLEAVIEGDLFDLWGTRGTRRTQRKIERPHDHVIVCGHGRVGRALAGHLSAGGDDFVVVDSEAKLLRAGADRVINPQAIGGARFADAGTAPRLRIPPRHQARCRPRGRDDGMWREEEVQRS